MSHKHVAYVRAGPNTQVLLEHVGNTGIDSDRERVTML